MKVEHFAIALRKIFSAYQIGQVSNLCFNEMVEDIARAFLEAAKGGQKAGFHALCAIAEHAQRGGYKVPRELALVEEDGGARAAQAAQIQSCQQQEQLALRVERAANEFKARLCVEHK